MAPWAHINCITIPFVTRESGIKFYCRSSESVPFYLSSLHRGETLSSEGWNITEFGKFKGDHGESVMCPFYMRDERVFLDHGFTKPIKYLNGTLKL